MAKHKIIVMGAGPAGLMAAGQAAGAGADVTVLEKMNQPARKLRITGKGRCNITNIASIQEFISHFGRNGKFLRQAFSIFSNEDLIRFLSELGVETIVERGGRVFPVSNDANDIANMLLDWNRKSGVIIRTSTSVIKLMINDSNIKGVIIESKRSKNTYDKMPGTIINADSVIIATGGASYPATGSTGDGYKIAKEAGHKIISIKPALVPLTTSGITNKFSQELLLKNINAMVLIQGKKNASYFGDMVLTNTSVSGPVILTMSRNCVDALLEGKKVQLCIDLKPGLDHNKLDQRIIRDIRESPKKTVTNLLKGILPSQLIDICLEYTNIDPDKPGNQITSQERKRLRLLLKDFTLDITGYESFDKAIITAGGIDTKEINPRTMESRIVKGLYFAGEILDIDADTGGYNLQAAFSTGWLAGRSAGKS